MSILSCESVTKRFGTTLALQTVSFSLDKGEYVGFLGPNGAGKTTMIHCLLGLMNPTSGDISVFGKNPWLDSQSNNAQIGYIPSDPYFYPELTGNDHISYVSQLNNNVDTALVKTLVQDLQFDPSLRIGVLSTGNKQKLSIILALMRRPALLIMDEPTRGLDPLLQRVFFEHVASAHENGATIFMSSHNLAEVQQYCSRVLLIKSGSIIEDAQVAYLSEKQLHSVIITTGNPVALQKKLKGQTQVTSIENGLHKLTFQVSGDIKQILLLLQDEEFSDISINGASLEEVFMKYYQ